MRPGRCAANIEFPRLKRSEAEEWIARKNGQMLPKGNDFSLAELYSILEGGEPLRPSLKPAPGFGLRP